RDLGGGADGEAFVIADDRSELFLVLAEVRLEIHLDATVLEDLHGGGRESVRDKHFGCHGSLPTTILRWGRSAGASRRRVKSGGLGQRFLRLGEGPVEPL